ncbi:MAG: hydrogenase iron-sulfur subunit [archaeon YNP-WB-040]|nr:hydrogenase iron-sulfur subunit [Candidatus Culexarchaeum yellowstonense]
MQQAEVFKPKIIGFLCNWCGYAAADLAGNLRKTYSSNLRIVRVMCSGRVDPTHILYAFQHGADGVLIIGCHPGDCHYINGNYRAKMKVEFLKKFLQEMGINPDRLHIDWASAGEGDRFSKIVDDFTYKITKLGPCEIKYGRL